MMLRPRMLKDLAGSSPQKLWARVERVLISEQFNQQKDDVGRIRTYAPEGTRFLVLRDNHSATTPLVDTVEQLL
jgi:hypothetical protein